MVTAIVTINMYLFYSPNNPTKIYRSPESWVLDQPDKTVAWGTKLNVIEIIQDLKTDPNEGIIQAMFYHEAQTGSVDSIYWVSSKKDNCYDSYEEDNIVNCDQDKVWLVIVYKYDNDVITMGYRYFDCLKSAHHYICDNITKYNLSDPIAIKVY